MGKTKRPDDDDTNNNPKRTLLYIIKMANKKKDDCNSCDDSDGDTDSNSEVSVDRHEDKSIKNYISKSECKNHLCDHMGFSEKELDLGFNTFDFVFDLPDFKFNKKNVETIDDLIELGYYYHCKKRKIYKDVDLEKLFNLIEPLTELKQLVGMQSVKQSMVDQILFFLQKLNKKDKCNECIDCINNLKCTNIKENDDMLHTVITGPPGVGKTELGKILGKVYKALGILSKGHVNIARRPDLIAKYLGQTAPKTQAFIDKCKGGVMFIDEAYSLGNPEGRDSFSKECIDTLNQNLTERRDFLCIIAGYEDALESSFFSYNEGLKRRFSFCYNIDKYTGDELYKIFKLKINKENWSYDDSEDKLLDFFKKNVNSFPKYGGDMETLFLKTKIMHSRRIMLKDPELRKKLNFDDVKKGYDNFMLNRKTKDDSLPSHVSHMYI